MVMSMIFSSSIALGKQELRLNIAGEPDSLDPRTSNNVNASLVLSLLFQGLTELEADGSVSFALAESVDISKDRRTYTFYLKKTDWSDGKPLIADDFEYAWKTCLDPKTPVPCANLLYPIKNAEAAKKGAVSLDKVGVKAKDKYTLVVELDQPVPFFLDLVAASVFYPVPKHQAENDAKWGTNHNFAVNGPFKMASWAHNNEICLERNSLYWNAPSVKLDQVHVAMITDEMTALQMFKSGKLDWVGGDYSPLPLDALVKLKSEGQMQKAAYGGTRYCALNINEFPFNNLNIRKAFSIAVNRQALIDNITFCDDEIATNMISSVFNKNQQTSLFPDGDVELARSYLKKGLQELQLRPEDLNVTFKYENSEIAHRLAQAMQQQWNKTLGVNVKLEAAELKTFIDSMRRHNFQIGLIYWMLHYNSPMDIMDRYRSKDLLKNYPGWENRQYTQLLDDYFVEPDEQKGREILAQAEKIFIADMPVIPLFHFSRPYLSKPTLKGLHVSPIGDVFFNEAYFEEIPLLAKTPHKAAVVANHK
jgi:oligopeptide transport system substrate-binding protein